MSIFHNGPTRTPVNVCTSACITISNTSNLINAPVSEKTHLWPDFFLVKLIDYKIFFFIELFANFMFHHLNSMVFQIPFQSQFKRTI